MNAYVETKIFRKYWGWFAAPQDISNVAIANFFSYEKYDVPGFHRTSGLTSVIDLSRSLEDIWLGMRNGFIRKQIEQGQRRGIAVQQGGDFDEFYALYRTFARRMQFQCVQRVSLRDHGILFTACHDSALLAGGVFIGDGTYLRAWALASAGDEYGQGGRMRELKGAANRLVLWEAIRWAKAQGYRAFDLGGMGPDDPNPHERGIAAFKEAFGGVRVDQHYYFKVYSHILRLWMAVRRQLPL